FREAFPSQPSPLEGPLRPFADLRRVFHVPQRKRLDVIWHEAIAPNLDAVLPAALGHRGEVGCLVVLVEKGLLLGGCLAA
ncbi:MAG: hypothetical protein ACUVQK_07050, partial [Thermogutta sp.]